MQALRLAVTAGLLVAAATAQLSLVVPAGMAAAEGASSTAYPWGRGTGQIRVQYVYDSTHFTGQGITFPILINHLKWRANGAAVTAGYVYSNVTVQLSSAAVDQLTPSTTFAANHGFDLAIVHAGAVAVATPSGTTPNDWYVDLPITPFLYDPSTGVDLCVDLAHDGVGPGSTSGPALDCMTTGALTSRIYNLTSYTSPTGSVQQNVGPVVEVGYVPAQGLYPGFSATPLTGSSPLAVQFTDSSFTSDPGGILAWLWDVDNDGTTDYTVQNPTHTYTSCGSYTVALTVVDGTGQQTETKIDYITVDPITAGFTTSASGGFAPVTVQFTDTSTGSIAVWLWDVDGDNVTDYAVQNPLHVYTTPGNYTVTLTVLNGCFTEIETKLNCITVLAPGTVPAQPEILQYQFNETSGTDVANTATTAVAPAHGVISPVAWQGDAGRPGFKGNEAGYGCVAYTGVSTTAGYVNTGWTTNLTGSFSISFWLRRDPASTTTNPFGYVFGDGSFRAFCAGAGGQGVTFRGSAIGSVDSVFPVFNNPGVWQHLTLVVDDAAGQARWYDNGTPSTTTVSFTPNSFSYAGGAFAVGAQNTSGGSRIGTHYHLDDFRLYGRALLPAEVQILALLSEHASAGSYGSACAGPGGTPVISGNGVPSLGNASYAVDLSNAENGRLAAIVFGFAPAAFGSFNIDPWLTGPGCALQTDNLALGIHTTAGNAASQPFAVPNFAGLAGQHIYSQWVILGTLGAVTRVLDSNLE
jgi:PKD repeat protein